MARTAFSTGAAVFILSLTLLTGNAGATDTSKALSICISRGTACTVTNKDGGYEICVDNTGGRECVKCPPLTASDQTCTTARTIKGGIVDKLQQNKDLQLKSE